MAIGVGLGHSVPGLLQAMESLPVDLVAIGLMVMMYPPLAKIDHT